MHIRQAKTDPRDALLIAEVIRFGHFSESTLHPENIYELRELCRGRHAIVSMQADVKRKVVALLDQVFPEYETAFTNMFGDTSMAILQTCPTPKELSEIDDPIGHGLPGNRQPPPLQLLFLPVKGKGQRILAVHNMGQQAW